MMKISAKIIRAGWVAVVAVVLACTVAGVPGAQAQQDDKSRPLYNGSGGRGDSGSAPLFLRRSRETSSDNGAARPYDMNKTRYSSPSSSVAMRGGVPVEEWVARHEMKENQALNNLLAAQRKEAAASMAQTQAAIAAMEGSGAAPGAAPGGYAGNPDLQGKVMVYDKKKQEQKAREKERKFFNFR